MNSSPLLKSVYSFWSPVFTQTKTLVCTLSSQETLTMWQNVLSSPVKCWTAAKFCLLVLGLITTMLIARENYSITHFFTLLPSRIGCCTALLLYVTNISRAYVKWNQNVTLPNFGAPERSSNSGSPHLRTVIGTDNSIAKQYSCKVQCQVIMPT